MKPKLGRVGGYPWRRRMAWTGIAVAIVLAAVLAAITMARTRTTHRLEVQLTAMRKAGIAVTPEDFERRHQPPAQETGEADSIAPYDQAFEIDIKPPPELTQETIEKEILEKAPDGLPYPQALREKLHAYLELHRRELELLHKAAQSPPGRRHIDLNAGMNLPLPHLAATREAARLLRTQALLAIDEGDTDTALKAMLAAIATAESLRHEPILISQLVRVACHGPTEWALEQALGRGRFDESQLAELQHALAAAEDPGRLERAFSGELVLAIDGYDHPGPLLPFFDNVGLARVLPGRGDTLVTGMRILGLWERDRLRYLEQMNAAITAAALPSHEALDDMDELGRTAPAGLWPSVLGYHMRSYSDCAGVLTTGSAYTRNSATALAVERYHLVHGALPEDLSGLVPQFLDAVPLDPFDGQPLRYRRNANGYRVYSIGRNRTDEGGQVPPPSGPNTTLQGDEAFVVEW